MFKSNRLRKAYITPLDADKKVQPGLAFTPSQMLELQRQGIPISEQTVGNMYHDGYRNADFEPAMENMRGVDVADLWEHQQKVRKQYKEARNNGVFKSETQTE